MSRGPAASSTHLSPPTSCRGALGMGSQRAARTGRPPRNWWHLGLGTSFNEPLCKDVTNSSAKHKSHGRGRLLQVLCEVMLEKKRKEPLWVPPLFWFLAKSTFLPACYWQWLRASLLPPRSRAAPSAARPPAPCQLGDLAGAAQQRLRAMPAASPGGATCSPVQGPPWGAPAPEGAVIHERLSEILARSPRTGHVSLLSSGVLQKLSITN